MATITNDIVAATPPKKLHAGENVLVCRISLSATFSAGDIFRVGKLPHGIIPLDAVFYMGPAFTNASTGACLKMGVSASMDLFFASATFSVGGGSLWRSTIAQGTRRKALFSLSDDAGVRYEYVTFVPTSGTSVGHIGDLVIRYLANDTA